MGGVILHELGERFNSPTVNLFFKAEDYLKFLENLDYYLKQALVEVESEKNYPVAKLDDITIYFMHYSSFDEAKTTWQKRVARINKNNLYTEKKLLQAQHRLEEAQARDRVKERKARTRRLIQEGAILEKVLPEVRTMEPSVLEDYLMQKLPQHD